MMMVASTFIACGEAEEPTTPTDPFILDSTLTAEEREQGIFTPEVMWKMANMGSAELSPDGRSVAYSLTRYNLSQNRSSTSLWVQPFEGGEPRQLTEWGERDGSPQWSADGSKIYFLSSREKGTQLWSISPEGEDMARITNIKGGISGYGVTKSGDRMWYSASVEVKPIRSKKLYEDMPESKVLIYDDLMVRHWNSWDTGSYVHLFVAQIEQDKMVSKGTDINEGEPWDSPTSPSFSSSEVAWNNRGDELAYTSRKLTGYEYAVSTNTDIYIYNIEDGSTRNLTEGMEGYDKYPIYSPDDEHIAWMSQERAGNESDKHRLMVMSSRDGSDKRCLTENFDYNADDVVWCEDGAELYFLTEIEATVQLCRVSTKGNDVEVITSGDHNYVAFSKSGANIAAVRTTYSTNREWFAIDPTSGRAEQRSDLNKEIYDSIQRVEFEKRWVETTDGEQMLTWVIFPPDFDPTKRYPTLLYCQGGPQSTVSQFWSYRWNMQLIASQGYIVVAPNRRGVPSFGTKWLDQISGDYSGQNISDYLSAIDDVAKEPWADEERLGCVGASYGGYSTFYLAGHHEGRFKAFIAHCGIFNLTSMYGGTEELWFVNRDLGGAYWDEQNSTAQRSYENSPHKAVNSWDTPILIITGSKDYRIPYSQSLEAFTAARSKGIDSRLVMFEDEGHIVTKLQNNVVWNREFFGWLDKYLKK